MNRFLFYPFTTPILDKLTLQQIFMINEVRQEQHHSVFGKKSRESEFPFTDRFAT